MPAGAPAASSGAAASGRSSAVTATAVLAIHYQNENCHPDGKVKFDLAETADWRRAAMAAAGRLLEGARRHGVPLVHVRLAFRADFREVMQNAPIFRDMVARNSWVEGSWGAEFLEGLGPLPGERVVTHHRNNAFYAAALEAYVTALGVRHLVIAGVSTAYAVESAVRHAVDLGYEVTVAADACSTATRAQHEAGLRSLALLAAIRSADEIVADFARG